ncbi:helix-turn-helix transcriptional regulator (plasmid) [Streptomyces erythrochromogenes]|uniref:Helix-turn-helix transcriptional regulator n=1 Tax=Streptomyces erythrochromogenes TaxID=285574 RepID=A0ABZ1QPE0_9ACTN|nr:helix-turn-helix transcriptional regulator [Streptomyces erythrochromogenes]
MLEVKVTATHDPVSSVDVLLHGHTPLLPPVFRGPLRRAAGLTQRQVAQAVGVQPLQILRWEAGEAEPRPGERRVAYSRLLQGLAQQHPHVITSTAVP